MGVTIKGKTGKDIEFFFDRVLGRLCYGEHESKSNAAYIRKGSDFESEVYAYFELARKSVSADQFSRSDIEVFDECFKKAKVYSGVK